MAKNQKTLFNFVFIALTIAVVAGFVFIEWFARGGYNNNHEPAIRPVSASKLNIRTDQNSYQPGKTVKIAMVNSAQNPIIEKADSAIRVKSDRFLGINYGVGLIEKFIREEWIAVEPVWRCDSSCFEKCRHDYSLKPGKEKIFAWPQTILICDRSGLEEKVKPTGPGRYRVSSAVWSDKEQKDKIVYSNEFIIN